MKVQLVVVGGKNAGRVVPVSSSRFFLGRAPNCHLRCHSPAIAPHHCVILAGADSVGVLDVGNEFGTYVNGQRVTRYRRLETHDRLRAGPFEFEVRVVADSAHETASEVAGPGVKAERLRDQRRGTSDIVGACKTAQARCTAATTEEGAAEALKKLMSRGRRNSHVTR